MKFDNLAPASGEKFKHRIMFDTSEEAMAVWSAFRELVVIKALAGEPVADQELDLSENWGEVEGQDECVLINDLEEMALILEEFHQRTGEAVLDIAQRAVVQFDSDD